MNLKKLNMKPSLLPGFMLVNPKLGLQGGWKAGLRGLGLAVQGGPLG